MVQLVFFFFCRIVANYLLWRAAGASVTYLTEELRQRQLQYGTIVTGKTERASRWKECIDMAAGRYFSLHLLPPLKAEAAPVMLFAEDMYVLQVCAATQFCSLLLVITRTWLLQY